MHLTLRDDAVLVLVHELDRVFDREDVIVAAAIDEVDQRAQRRGLSRSSRPGDEDEAFGEEAQPLHFLADVHLLDRHDGRGDLTEHGKRAVAVARRVDAESRHAIELVGVVGIVVLLVLEPVPLRHDRTDHAEHLLVGQGRAVLPHHLAVISQDGRLRDAEMQIGRALLHHEAQEIVDAGARAFYPLERKNRVELGLR